MRTIVIFIALMFCNAIINAQVPRTFKYQTLAHDQTGNIYSNKDLTFKISILKGIVSGKLVYSEIHKATTNASGLVELNIGNGNFILTDFTSIDWLDDTYFIKVEMDTTGNGTFINMSTSQLLSVPYSLASKISEQVADNSVTTSKIANNAVNISKLPPGASSTTYLRGDGKWAFPPISLISLGGENGNIQYNNSGSLGGSSELFFDSVNQRLGIGNKSPSAKLHISTSGSESFPQLRLHENSNEYSRLMFQNNSDPGYWMISAKNSSDKSKEILKFSNIPKSRIMIFSGDGKVAINPSNENFSNARLSILEDNSNNLAILATK
ncbi:MAG: hypothetical protein IPH57_06665 [Saprospiraceae bacterium]|nr:hypothetical protein [Saprospiraceae bacterium]